VQDYYMINETLPASLTDIPEFEVPTAPEGRASYRYTVTEAGFELCATFAQASDPDEYSNSVPMMEKSLIRNPDNWSHGAGEVCFDRIINKTDIQK
jgi:hypothetical protein